MKNQHKKLTWYVWSRKRPVTAMCEFSAVRGNGHKGKALLKAWYNGKVDEKAEVTFYAISMLDKLMAQSGCCLSRLSYDGKVLI